GHKESASAAGRAGPMRYRILPGSGYRPRRVPNQRLERTGLACRTVRGLKIARRPPLSRLPLGRWRHAVLDHSADLGTEEVGLGLPNPAKDAGGRSPGDGETLMASLGDVLSGRVYAHNVNVWEPSLRLLLDASRVASGPLMPRFFTAGLGAMALFYDVIFRRLPPTSSFLRRHLKAIRKEGGKRLARLTVGHIALFFPRNQQNLALLEACSLSPDSLLTRVTQAMSFTAEDRAMLDELRDRSDDPARYGVHIATLAYNRVALQPGVPPIDQAYAFMRSLHEAYGFFLEELTKQLES
ncbi:MAG: hypothetical protein AB1700_20625, partial [Bacillota bacterium]